MLLLIFLAASCKKETIEKYPVSFKIELLDPDNVIFFIDGQSMMYYPQKDEWILNLSCGWERIDGCTCNDPRYLHNYYNELIIPVADSAYSGCVAELYLTIAKRIDSAEVIESYIISDTIRDIHQAKTIVVRWPQDTANYQVWGIYAKNSW
jgi:hypothetical protein